MTYIHGDRLKQPTPPALASANGYGATVTLDIGGHGTRLRGRFQVERARKLMRFQLRCIEDAARAENPIEYEI